jgi:hypothetical protein
MRCNNESGIFEELSVPTLAVADQDFRNALSIQASR